MSEEKIKVTTVIGGRENNFVWDPALPCSLDTNRKWVLESRERGLRIRYLGAENYKICPNSAVWVDEQTIAKKTFIRLPHSEVSEEIKVKLQRLKQFNPVYLSKLGVSGQDNQLFAFSGAGKALLHSQPLYSTYVAYIRKNPMFTIYQQKKEPGKSRGESEGETYLVKPLLKGVRLKLKGQKSTLGTVGESWKITKEQLLTSTFIRGSYWWRFNAFGASGQFEDSLGNQAWEDRESLRIIKVAGILAFIFSLFSLMIWWWPREEKLVEPPVEAPVVKFIEPKKKIIFKTRTEKKLEKQSEEPPRSSIAKDIKTAAANPAGASKPAASAPAAVSKPAASTPVVASKPAASTPAMASKPVSSNLSAVTKPITLTAPSVPKAVALAPRPVVKVDPNKLAAEVAAKKMSSLRDILSGATANISKTPIGSDSPVNKSVPVFGKSGLPVSSTDVKPGYVSKQSQTGAVGFSGQGIVGYSSGERVAAGNGKPSFVPVDSGSVSVEQGLTQDEVGAVIYNHLAEVRYCHDTAVLYTPRLEGKLVVKFAINAQGRVVRVAVQSSDLPEHMLENCLLKKLATWQFPHPKGGTEVSVGYPFIFKTLGRE